MLGTTAVRDWSTNQAVIALSSGEAEYYAALKGASQALGFQSMLKDIGLQVSCHPLQRRQCGTWNHSPRRFGQVAAYGGQMKLSPGGSA